TRSARSIVITTADSEYGPDVNTAIQVDAESAKTAPEDGKSVTAPVDVEQAQAGDGKAEEGEDNEAMTPVETKTLPEI
uniref:Uncharacterized protein n=1 Tax=Meloidogyne javanica TaxID=6303 RepID=A0A915NBI4_MELJA